MSGLKGVIVIYALLDIVDGLAGFVANRSVPWLVWNAGFGFFVLGGLMLARTKPRAGYPICALFAGLDTVFFGRKLVKTLALWPAGIITFAAVAALLCAVIEFSRASRKSP